MNQKDPKQELAAASTAYRQGRYSEAIAILRELDGQCPNQPEILYGLALAWRAIRADDKALALAGRLKNEFNDPRGVRIIAEIRQAHSGPSSTSLDSDKAAPAVEYCWYCKQGFPTSTTNYGAALEVYAKPSMKRFPVLWKTFIVKVPRCAECKRFHERVTHAESRAMSTYGWLGWLSIIMLIVVPGPSRSLVAGGTLLVSLLISIARYFSARKIESAEKDRLPLNTAREHPGVISQYKDLRTTYCGDASSWSLSDSIRDLGREIGGPVGWLLRILTMEFDAEYSVKYKREAGWNNEILQIGAVWLAIIGGVFAYDYYNGNFSHRTNDSQAYTDEDTPGLHSNEFRASERDDNLVSGGTAVRLDAQGIPLMEKGQRYLLSAPVTFQWTDSHGAWNETLLSNGSAIEFFGSTTSSSGEQWFTAVTRQNSGTPITGYIKPEDLKDHELKQLAK